jgi:hypothetical protein
MFSNQRPGSRYNLPSIKPDQPTNAPACIYLICQNQHPQSDLHLTPTPSTSLLNVKAKYQPVQIPHPHPLLVVLRALDNFRRLRSTQPAPGKLVCGAHALVVHDELLVNIPGLVMVCQKTPGGLGLDCLADGGDEEEVAEASKKAAMTLDL